jgi:hypothetical protein
VKELIGLEVPQFELLNSRRFVDYLDARDIDMHEDELEYFEKTGFIYPVLRLKRPVVKENDEIHYGGISSSAWYLKRYSEMGLLEFPNPNNFHLWNEYKGKKGEENTLIYYHPYQAFLIIKFLNLTRVTLTSSYLETLINCEKMLEQERKLHQTVKKAFLDARPRLIMQIGLLLYLQNAYQPNHRGRLTLTPDQKSYERWTNWRENVFSASSTLEKSGMSLTEVADLRDYFAVQAHFTDPMSSWYPLIRLVPFGQREKLKGKALLAQDYYEIVHILNFFLKDLTEKEQPEPDDIIDGRRGKWKDDYYGRKFKYEDKDIQKRIISDYLYVSIPKVVLLVEGDTEEISIPILMNALGIVPEIAGIHIVNFQGTGGLIFSNAGPVLQSAKSQNVARYLIVDNDKDVTELVKELSERRNLLDDNCCRIWEKEFHQDNFGTNAVVEIVSKELVKNGFASIETGEVNERMVNHPEEKLWKAIYSIFWMRNEVKLDDVVSKVGVARTLSMKRAEEISQETKDGKYKTKWKIEEDIMKIYERFCQ